MPKVLLSVSDKTGIFEFATALVDLGYDIISTGGTFKILQEKGITNLTEVSDFTGFPEGLEGRIKTLTPHVFGGLLAKKDNPDHQDFCYKNNIQAIDIVVVNLYPFHYAYYDKSKNFAEIVEQIDIGGPSMIRAAAKNYKFCLPVVDPADYDGLIEKLKNGDVSQDDRKKLATKVFEMTAHYDMLIAKFWAEQTKTTPEEGGLRYGENPHQGAVVLRDPFAQGVDLVGAKLLNGKPLSYNNFHDAAGALELGMAFSEPFSAIIKHATPCGAAIADTPEEAFTKAYEADKTSAFGGIIVVNREISAVLAEKITSFFCEVVLAPKISQEALKIFAKKPNLRVLEIPNFEDPVSDYSIRRIRGGTLMQNIDDRKITEEDLKFVSGEAKKNIVKDMIFSWKLVKIVKSNAIVIAKNGVMIGKGGGQTSRVEAMSLALKNAGENSYGAVIASDAFFPFPDSLKLAIEQNICGIIQPGGAQKDADVIALAQENNISMAFTGIRAFLH